MPILKAGHIYHEDGSESEATWTFDPGTCVDVMLDDCIIIRIQPDDLLAIAAALEAQERREHQKQFYEGSKGPRDH